MEYGATMGIVVDQYDGTDTENFFNVGDWNTPSALTANTNHVSETGFVQKLNTGNRLKWKEDPDANIYIINGSPSQINCYRHSTESYSVYQQSDGGTNSLQAFMSSSRGLGDTQPLINGPHISGGSTFAGGAGGTGGVGGAGVLNSIAGCKAEGLSFNFSQNWALPNIQGQLKWDPTSDGEIISGINLNILAADSAGLLGGGADTCTGGSALSDDLIIFVQTLNDPTGATTGSLHQGMALQRYTKQAGSAVDQDLATNLGGDNDFLVIRDIKKVLVGGNITHYELFLGGYRKPMELGVDHKLAIGLDRPANNKPYTFVQVGINGYSANSEFNINTMGPTATVPCGKVGAVSYTLQFVEEIEPLEILSENPAIFETEPKDSKDLDIYYEATSAIPMTTNADNLHDAFPVGSTIETLGTIHTVTGHNNLAVQFDVVTTLAVTVPLVGPYYLVSRPDGLELEVSINVVDAVTLEVTIDPFLYNGNHKLPYHNCYSFGNGVESNRIRDNYNLPFISNGVKASTTLEQEYEEEHRKYGLIYSGLYNSTSGVNNLNQFIQAEKITKDVNPIYGSIQKLHARDSDLVALCEDKCLRILSNKDAVFNAGGNTNLTATENVLGQTIPFSGEYGISTNPESFASEAYRVYFTDKVRGAVLRLSKDGLTPISNYGMKDWFRDNLRLADKIFGSHDDRNDEYNIALKNGIRYGYNCIL